MEQLQLTPRLQRVAELVPQGARLADIGTDHAHLPVWLLLHGRIASAIGADIRPGPLERAERTCRTWSVEDRVQLRLCPGLTQIRPEEVDTVTICGMGGEVMIGILDAAPWTRQGITLILQPQSCQPKLRRWLVEHGYAIQQEHIVREAHRWYPILLVRGGAGAALSPAECLAGQPSCWRREPLRLDYLAFLHQQCQRQLAALQQAKSPDELGRQETLRGCLAALETWQTQLKEEESPCQP
jgi:tRNA (adenine22-N1)-methyltransferase